MTAGFKALVYTAESDGGVVAIFLSLCCVCAAHTACPNVRGFIQINTGGNLQRQGREVGRVDLKEMSL